MAYLHEHCQDCKERLGREWREVHQWLDGLYAVHGHDHRQHRHHAEGVEEVRSLWGDEAALAAQIHIIVDCWGIPAKADYETGRVNRNGFTPESTEADVDRLLAEVKGELMEKTILYRGYLVQVDLNGEAGRFLWGRVQFDGRRRYQMGDWVCSTMIIEETDGGYRTQNSFYEVFGPVVNCRLKEPETTLLLLRNGVEPSALGPAEIEWLDQE